MSRRLTVLLAAVLDWAGTARLPQAFAEAGCDVIVHAPPAHLVNASRHVHERVPAPEALGAFVASLRRLVEQRRFDHCVACDDPLLYALADHRNAPWAQALLPTPATGSQLDFVISKLIFPATCARAGLPVPATRIQAGREAIETAAAAMGFPVVAKLARGFGGHQVRLLATPQQLVQLMAELPAAAPLVLQKPVAGRSGSCCAVWIRGELKAWFSFHVVRSWPHAFSPSATVRLVDRPAMEPMLHAIGRISGFHGLGGIDFIERDDGSLVLTEQHGRPVPQFVLASRAGIDMARALRALVADDVDAPAQRPSPAIDDRVEIPLFPQEAIRMIGTGRTRELARWKSDPLHRAQLGREDRPLWRATLRFLRRWAHETWNDGRRLHGCYINLDRSAERRGTMEAQLQRCGLAWIERFSATDGRALPPRPGSLLTAGEVGCFVSHLHAIEQARPAAATLVFEDDAIIHPQLAAVLQRLGIERLLDYDIVFLDCQPVASAGNLLMLWQSLQQHAARPDASAPGACELCGVNVLEARGLYLWAAAAYLVTPRGRDSLPHLLRAALEAGPTEAFDTVLHRLIAQGRIRAAVLAPFLATPRLECWADTTIEGRPRLDSDVIAAALRHLFFAGDTRGAQAHAAPVRHKPLTDNPDLQLMADLLAQAFVASANGSAVASPASDG